MIGVELLNDLSAALRIGLAAMLVVTASAHFGSCRSDVIRMVPPVLPRADLLVSLTGVVEILIAVLLLVDPTSTTAATALVAFLVAVFPANVHAARVGVGIGGRPPTPLGVRAAMQSMFIGAAVAVAVG